jgi:hypothetical protein
MNVFRKLTTANLIGIIGVASFAIPAHATLSANLDSRCKPTSAPPVAVFKHLAGQGYWAHHELDCSVGFYAVMKVQKTVNGVTTVVQTTATQSYGANTYEGSSGAAFTPLKGVAYQVLVNVYKSSDGSSLGYFSSGPSQVLVAA